MLYLDSCIIIVEGCVCELSRAASSVFCTYARGLHCHLYNSICFFLIKGFSPAPVFGDETRQQSSKLPGITKGSQPGKTFNQTAVIKTHENNSFPTGYYNQVCLLASFCFACLPGSDEEGTTTDLVLMGEER